ncbi:MAG: hypothetical protein ACKPKO_06705, partial [Candidatus Fonsibacter sp.]
EVTRMIQLATSWSNSLWKHLVTEGDFRKRCLTTSAKQFVCVLARTSELANRWPVGIKVFDKKHLCMTSRATTSASLAAGIAIKLRGTSAHHWNLEVEVVHPAQVKGTRNHFWNLVSRADCPFFTVTA